MTVSLLEILGAARVHAAPLAAESAGYLLLAVADHVVAAPRVVGADEVELMPDGSVRLRVRRGGAADAGAEQVLRRLLGRTLEVSSSVGPALRRAAQRTQDAGLPALVRELETALIPVNRSAAKRALSRLHRETERAKSAGKLVSLPESDPPVVTAPVVTAPVVATPVVTAPVVAAPVVTAPVVAAPVVTAPVVAAPVVATPEDRAESIDWLTEYPEPSPLALPLVQAAPLPRVEQLPARPQKPAAPPVELTLTPEPRIAAGEDVFTKPEPVVQRARERGSSTPRLGTLVTLQTLPGEESDRTERAPAVLPDDEPELDLSIDVELEPEVESQSELAVESQSEPEVESKSELAVESQSESEAITLAPPAGARPQPLVDPEPSCMPDVLMAMVELHTGIDADEAPTRIRDVVTELRIGTPAPPVEVALTPSAAAEVAPTPSAAAAEVALTPSAAAVEVVLTPSTAAAEVAPTPSAAAAEVALTPALGAAVAVAVAVPAPFETPAPELVEDAWLTSSSLCGVTSAPVIFRSELAAPEVHEALTWNPGPVLSLRPLELPPALVIAEPLPEPSPYAPAVLPSRTSEVSELLDSFHVSDAAEERDLRSALKEMAGLELTPMPHPYVEEG